MQVVAHGVSDVVDLPGELRAALPAFDGRPTEAVLRAIAADHGIGLKPSLMRKLVDFELLLPAAGPAARR